MRPYHFKAVPNIQTAFGGQSAGRRTTKVLAIAGRELKHSASNLYLTSAPAGIYKFGCKSYLQQNKTINIGIGGRNSEALPSPILNRKQQFNDTLQWKEYYNL